MKSWSSYSANAALPVSREKNRWVAGLVQSNAKQKEVVSIERKAKVRDFWRDKRVNKYGCSFSSRRVGEPKERVSCFDENQARNEKPLGMATQLKQEANANEDRKRKTLRPWYDI